MIDKGPGVPDNWEMENDSVYLLRLFVAGTSSMSIRAISNLTRILEEHLPERYELEIIDVHQHHSIAAEENIAAVPMLVKRFPDPVRRLIGDMSDTAKVLRGLGLT
jgi:circadian clock protein KaiB